MSVQVIVWSDGSRFYLKRSAEYCDGRREETFDLTLEEIDQLITDLKKVRATVAENKRRVAQQLFDEADRLDPKVREA